jgi:hypothetical protein
MDTNTIPKPAEITESFEDYCARVKPVLIGALAGLGATHASIRYDGYGDQGAVEEVSAFLPDESAADLSGEIDYPTYETWTCVTRATRASLECALTDFAEIILAHHYCGWENGDGAVGTIEIDVADDCVVVEHAIRVMTTEGDRVEF